MLRDKIKPQQDILKSKFHTNNLLLKNSAPHHYNSQTVVGVRENNSSLLPNCRENINTDCGQNYLPLSLIPLCK
jgi:hypothetical protein